MTISADSLIRSQIFEELDVTAHGFTKINDRQFGIIIKDKDGVERYARLGVIVAAKDDEVPARAIMASEIADYETKQANKAERAQRSKEKAERDKARRAAAKAKKAGD